MFSLKIGLILINILKISFQSSDQDKKGCLKNGCFPAFCKKIFNVKSKGGHHRQGQDRSESGLDPNAPSEMRELKISEFLDFKEETLKDLEEFDNQKCSCGKYLLRDMQKIEYGDDWHFRVWPEKIGKGTTSNIFHAHAMSDLKDFDGKPIRLEKCFALKSVLLEIDKIEGLENEMRNEIEILKRFARINSKHVIRLYDYKDFSKNRKRQLLFLMELGEHNLKEEFKNMKEQMENIWQTNKIHSEKLIEIEEIIKNKLIEILQAVKEMHKLAIHLDLKPENMLFVKEADGKGGHKMTLKVIDFGGSELIPENSEINVEKRANICKFRNEMWCTEFYASPEQRICCNKFSHRDEYEFSTKSDIWTVGVILLRMIIYAPMFKNGIGGVILNRAIVLITNMFKWGDDLIYIEKQKPPLRKILVILRDKFSQLFSKIMKATVNKVPAERTSARGLLDFIANNCRLILPSKKRAKFKSNSHPFIEKEYVEETISGQNSRQETLPECDQETTGNPLALSDEENSNESEVKLEETIVG